MIYDTVCKRWPWKECVTSSVNRIIHDPIYRWKIWEKNLITKNISSSKFSEINSETGKMKNSETTLAHSFVNQFSISINPNIKKMHKYKLKVIKGHIKKSS